MHRDGRRKRTDSALHSEKVKFFLGKKELIPNTQESGVSYHFSDNFKMSMFNKLNGFFKIKKERLFTFFLLSSDVGELLNFKNH